MAYRAKFWKKVRRWLGTKLDLQSRGVSSTASSQIGRLLSQRGSEVITMTTL